MRLFTFQKHGHDITKPFEPTADYYDPKGPFYEMSKLLGWPVWIWMFPTIHDFLTDTAQRWMFTDHFKYQRLWVLDVPDSHIAWIGLEDHCAGTSGRWIQREPELIRSMGDIPMGLVRAPIRENWVGEIYEHPGIDRGRRRHPSENSDDERR